MSGEERGHTYWILFVGLFNHNNVCVDVTGFFEDSDEPWTTSEFISGSPTRDLFELADDYFVRVGEHAKRELMQETIKFIGYFDEDWVLRNVGVIYTDQSEEDRVNAEEILEEDLERPLTLRAERWLREWGDTQTGV